MPSPTSQLINNWRKSPTAFVQDMWNLVPQPLKPQYQDVAKRVPLKDYKAEWFEPFQKGKHITWQQWVILLAVEKAMKYAAQKRISVASGHGIGKSSCASWLILWYLTCFIDAQVACTAPTSEQMHDVLWKEIAVWIGKMPKEFAGLYDWSAGYVRIKQRPETWFARAKTARKENPEALAGIHGDFVFILADEASGIANEIFRPAEGALTNENVLAMLFSNPTRNLGYFYDTQHADKLNWQCLSFSSEDSPIVEYGFCERIAEKYGIDSDEYRFMVKGLFPKEDTIDDKGYVPLLVSTDLKYTTEEKFAGRKFLGIDPAGEGSNKTVWVLRDNFKAKVVAVEETSNGKGIAQKTATLIDFYGMKKPRRTPDAEMPFYENVIVDSFGIGVDAIKELAVAGYNVNAQNVGELPYQEKPQLSLNEEEEKKLFLNKRAMIYDRLKNWLRSGGELVQHSDWHQLLQIKYTRTLAGKKKIMGKDEMRRQGIASPDCFIAGTKILTPQGNKNIEELEVGEKVITPYGNRKIIKKWEVETDKLTKVSFSNGKQLIGKPKHKILTKRGFVSLDTLLLTDIIEVRYNLSTLLWKTKNLLFIKERNIGLRKQADIFIKITEKTEKDLKSRSIIKFIVIFITKAKEFLKFQKDFLFTILIKIPLTISQKIYNFARPGGIYEGIYWNDLMIKRMHNQIIDNLALSARLPLYGTGQRRELNGIKNTEKKLGRTESLLKVNVLNAERQLLDISNEKDFAVEVARKNQNGKVNLIIQIKEFVYSVKKSLWQIGIGLQNVAVDYVQTDFVLPTKVYNLTLDKDNVYYANGILVENCADALALTFIAKESFIAEEEYKPYKQKPHQSLWEVEG